MQPDGGTTEWKSAALRTYQRRTHAAEALIASAYLAGVNTRRVRRALAALLGGAVGKDIVSRTWRKVKGDWDAWNARSLYDEPIVRLILDGPGGARAARPQGGRELAAGRDRRARIDSHVPAINRRFKDGKEHRYWITAVRQLTEEIKLVGMTESRFCRAASLSS